MHTGFFISGLHPHANTITMFRFYILFGMLFTIGAPFFAGGQQVFKGKIIDSTTKLPISGASIRCAAGCGCGCASNNAGEFELHPKESCCDVFEVSSVGYQVAIIQWGQPVTVISLQQDESSLQQVVVTANRE